MNENNYESGLYVRDVFPCLGSNWPCLIRAVLNLDLANGFGVADGLKTDF